MAWNQLTMFYILAGSSISCKRNNYNFVSHGIKLFKYVSGVWTFAHENIPYIDKLPLYISTGLKDLTMNIPF